MTTPEREGPDRAERAERDPDQARLSRLQRRRQKIADEIARNRRGDYRVPTWALALALVLLVAGWLTLVLLS